MDLQIKDKVMIVTGGSKGIGAAIVRRLASEGAVPIIAGRSEKEGLDIVKELDAKNQKSFFIKAELSSTNTCRSIVKEIAEKYGRIDALINNAGANDGVSLESGGPENFRASLNNNLYHYYDLAHYCLPWLKKTRGNIVNISSKTAITGQGNTSGYAAAKGAQLAFTREWAVELLQYNIRVNAVIPAEVMTPLYNKWLKTFDNPDEKLESIVKNIPLGQRMTTSEEIASMVAFVVSDLAGHLTGQFLFVDGGYVHLDRALAGHK